jgi:hypothetical protein
MKMPREVAISSPRSGWEAVVGMAGKITGGKQLASSGQAIGKGNRGITP